jgi:hypothetical protein
MATTPTPKEVIELVERFDRERILSMAFIGAARLPLNDEGRGKGTT